LPASSSAEDVLKSCIAVSLVTTLTTATYLLMTLHVLPEEPWQQRIIKVYADFPTLLTLAAPLLSFSTLFLPFFPLRERNNTDNQAGTNLV